MSEIVLNISNGRFIFGKDSFNFQQIRDDFFNAEEITIVTLDITRWWNRRASELLRELYRLENKHITIISNIPNRLSNTARTVFQTEHFNERNEHNQIISYLQALDPSRFASPTKVYFNFDNHAKVFIVDDLVYIGSANYSDASQINFEGGITFRDREKAMEIKEVINNDLIHAPETIIYAGSDKSAFHDVSYALSSLSNSVDIFCEKAFIFDDNGNLTTNTYTNDFTNLISDVINNIDECEDLFNRVDTIISKYEEFRRITSFFQTTITNIKNLSQNEDIINIFEFNINDYAHNYFADNMESCLESDEIDRLNDISYDKASLHEIDLLYRVYNQFERLRNDIIQIKNEVDVFDSNVKAIEDMELIIDETSLSD